MNILFILDYYAPMASANGICVEKIAKNLALDGNKVSVLSFGDQDDCTCDDNLNLYFCCREKQDKCRDGRIGTYAKWVMPFKYPSYERKKAYDDILDKADIIIKKDDIDTVVCVHLPIESLLVGVELKKKYATKKFVAYMLDSLSGGVLPSHLPKSYSQRKKIKWENRILDAFDKIILMQSSREHHEAVSKNELWYKRSVYLDIPLLVPNPLPNVPLTSRATIVFVGTIADNVRTPYHFLKVLNRSKTDIDLIFAGNNLCGNIAEYCSAENIKIQQLGCIPHDNAMSLIGKSNLLLNLGNKNKNLVPSKIFEYMSTGKPIISTFCSDDDSSIVYLKHYNNVFLINENDNDYDNQARMLDDFIDQCGSVKIDYKALVSELNANTPNSFIECITNM